MSEQESAGLFDKIDALRAENPNMSWDQAAAVVTNKDKGRQDTTWKANTVAGNEGGANSPTEQQQMDREYLADPTKQVAEKDKRPSFGSGGSSRLSAALK